MLQPFSFLIVVEKAIRGNTNVAFTEGHAAVKKAIFDYPPKRVS
jgi:hypothetical protein